MSTLLFSRARYFIQRGPSPGLVEQIGISNMSKLHPVVIRPGSPDLDRIASALRNVTITASVVDTDRPEVLRPIKVLVADLTDEHVDRQFYIFDRDNLRSPIFKVRFVSPSDSEKDIVRVGFRFQSGRPSSMHLPVGKEVFVYLPIADLPDSIPTPVVEGWL